MHTQRVHVFTTGKTAGDDVTVHKPLPREARVKRRTRDEGNHGVL